MKTILKVILIISYLIAIVVFAVWWGIEFREYSDNIVYSDNNLFRSVQHVTEVAWGLSMATSPVWTFGSVVLLVRYLFPSLKDLTP